VFFIHHLPLHYYTLAIDIFVIWRTLGNGSIAKINCSGRATQGSKIQQSELFLSKSDRTKGKTAFDEDKISLPGVLL